MQFTVTTPSVSDITKVVKRVPSGIAHLTTFALPATIALGFFVSWVAFGPYALLLLLPFLVAQKPDFKKSPRTFSHGLLLLGTGLVVAIGTTQFMSPDHLQGFMQSIANLRSVRTPLAEGAAAGNAADATVFIGEALAGLLLSFVVLYHMANPGEFRDTCSIDLRSEIKRTAMGWFRWTILWSVFCFVMFWINLSVSSGPITGWLLTGKAAMAPAIGYVFLVNAVGVIRALPLMIPDVEPRK